jgi:hypothetical protein
VLFDLKFGWESNTKKVEDILIFPTGIYLPSSDQWFRFYDFLHDDGFAENCNSGQIAATTEKLNLVLFGWDSSPELNTKKFENSPSFPSVTYIVSSDQRFTKYEILYIGKTAEIGSRQPNSWKEQKFRRLSESETPGLLNIIPLGNSNLFPVVHFTTPNGQQITSFGYRKMVGLLNQEKSGQIMPFGTNKDFGKILPWPP